MSCCANFPGCAVGAFVNGLENLENFQKQIMKKLALVLIYTHWTDPFPLAEVEKIYQNGSIPLLTWEPWITDPAGALDAISRGKYEAYVRDFIQALKDWGKPIFLRFAHEMNGNWYPWDGDHNGKKQGPEKYKQAWCYMYNVKEQLGAANAQLVWSPNNYSKPMELWNDLKNYYPGDQYVDWLGMDGYNWGGGSWYCFDLVLGNTYAQLTALTSKPIMIGEFGCAANGGSKAAWIKEALHRIKTVYPQIKAFCWFNVDKERDWRIDETAFRQAIADRYFVEKML